MTKIIFTFMRCNPPTRGHQYVIDLVRKLAHEHHCDHKIILSHSHDAKKNPLDPNTKLKYAEYFWPDIEFEVSDPEKPSMIHHLKALNEFYDEVLFVCGKDRYEEYMNLMKKYNGSQFRFRRIDCVEAGDEDTRESISSTTMRAWAKTGEFVPFFFGTPKLDSGDLSMAINMYQDVKKGLGLIY